MLAGFPADCSLSWMPGLLALRLFACLAKACAYFGRQAERGRASFRVSLSISWSRPVGVTPRDVDPADPAAPASSASSAAPAAPAAPAYLTAPAIHLELQDRQCGLRCRERVGPALGANPPINTLRRVPKVLMVSVRFAAQFMRSLRERK